MNQRIRSGAELVLFVAFCEMAGVVSSFFTTSSIPTWYAGIRKPRLGASKLGLRTSMDDTIRPNGSLTVPCLEQDTGERFWTLGHRSLHHATNTECLVVLLVLRVAISIPGHRRNHDPLVRHSRDSRLLHQNLKNRRTDDFSLPRLGQLSSLSKLHDLHTQHVTNSHRRTMVRTSIPTHTKKMTETAVQITRFAPLEATHTITNSETYLSVVLGLLLSMYVFLRMR